MTIRHDEEWVQIARLDEQDHIYFTDEYCELMRELDWEAKAFVGHLLGLWYDPFEHMLDYTSGDEHVTQDQPPGEFSNNWFDQPQDVVEYWSTQWSQNGEAHQPSHQAGLGLGLDAEWYRDVLRAKLVSLRLPKRLLVTYKERSLAKMEELEAHWKDVTEAKRSGR